MHRIIGITIGVIAGLAAYPGTATTGAQQTPTLTCNPKTIPSTGPSVTFTCSIENFPPNTAVPVTGPLGPTPTAFVTTDDAGRAGFTFLIPEFGVCAQLPGDLTVSASGGGVRASTTIIVTPVPLFSHLPPLYCGPAGAVSAQPRLTG
jgi:hypothetical protein